MRAGAEVQAVVFDWGDTLVHFPGLSNDRARHLACVETLYRGLAADAHAACFDWHGVNWPRFRAAYEAIADEQLAVSRATGREHRLQDRLARTLRSVGCRCPVDERALDDLTARLGDLFCAEARLVQEAPDVLAALGGRYRLGLVANYPWPPIVLATLEQYGLRPYFASLVVSGALGWAKPDPRPFRQALDELGVEPGRALFVGDDRVNDIRGAKALGFRTAWLAPGRTGEPEPAADYRLERLGDVLELPGLGPERRPPPASARRGGASL